MKDLYQEYTKNSLYLTVNIIIIIIQLENEKRREQNFYQREWNENNER